MSVGEADFIREILARLGEVSFWKLNIKPGRPMAFGKVGDAWLFGLPGNPVAVMVSYTQRLRSTPPSASGPRSVNLPERPLLGVTAANAIRKQPGRRGIPARHGGWWSTPLAGQNRRQPGSGVLRSMSEANCLSCCWKICAGVPAGDNVEVRLFDGV